VVTFHELRAYYLSYKQRKIPRHHGKDSFNSSDEQVSHVSPMTTLSHATMPPQPNSGFDLNRSSSLTMPPSNHNTESTPQPPRTMGRKMSTDVQFKNPNLAKVHRPRRKQWSGNWDPCYSA
jgi:hypothetical protein